MPSVRDTAELLKLKARLESLSPGDQLRIAAGLVDACKYDLAETIAGNIVDELRAKRLLANRD
jgi:hypothetical protein